MRFKGKTALVTGATSGIGAEVAHRLAGEGGRVIVSGRDPDRGAAICGELPGEGHLFVSADLAKSAGARALAGRVIHDFKSVDVLVNSAGVVYHKTVPETTDVEWSDTFAINVSAVFFLSRALIPGMIERGAGVIVNVASSWGLVGAERTAAYCASKGAVVQLTRAMAADHAKDGVRVNAVCPGAVDTPMLASEAAAFGISVEEGRRLWAADAPNNRLASAADIARTVLFLASDDAAHIHGAALPVDGGATAL